MSRILLAASLSRQSPEATNTALDEARRSNGSLVAAFVLETGVLKDAFERLGDAGIVGEKPGRQLEAAMLKEYRQKGYELLDRIEHLAKQSRVECKVLIEPGEFVDTVVRLARADRADLIVIKGIRRSALGRLLFGSEDAELQEKAPCPIRIVHA